MCGRGSDQHQGRDRDRDHKIDIFDSQKLIQFLDRRPMYCYFGGFPRFCAKELCGRASGEKRKMNNPDMETTSVRAPQPKAKPRSAQAPRISPLHYCYHGRALLPHATPRQRPADTTTTVAATTTVISTPVHHADLQPT